MSLQKKKSFNKEYYLQIHFQTNIHGEKTQTKQTEKLICMVSSIPANWFFIRDSKITSPLFCPNSLFFCFGSFGLMAPERWSFFLSQAA